MAQAGSVAEAREFPNEIDVAIIDLGLPDGNGIEVIKELREKNPKTIALVLSATSERTHSPGRWRLAPLGYCTSPRRPRRSLRL